MDENLQIEILRYLINSEMLKSITINYSVLLYSRT